MKSAFSTVGPFWEGVGDGMGASGELGGEGD
jgi:hypothetical protein